MKIFEFERVISLLQLSVEQLAAEFKVGDISFTILKMFNDVSLSPEI